MVELGSADVHLCERGTNADRVTVLCLCGSEPAGLPTNQTEGSRGRRSGANVPAIESQWN